MSKELGHDKAQIMNKESYRNTEATPTIGEAEKLQTANDQKKTNETQTRGTKVKKDRSKETNSILTEFNKSNIGILSVPDANKLQEITADIHKKRLEGSNSAVAGADTKNFKKTMTLDEINKKQKQIAKLQK